MMGTSAVKAASSPLLQATRSFVTFSGRVYEVIHWARSVPVSHSRYAIVPDLFGERLRCKVSPRMPSRDFAPRQHMVAQTLSLQRRDSSRRLRCLILVRNIGA